DAGRQIAAIREIQRFGAEVLVQTVDISDARQAADLFATLPGELGGILHLATAGKMAPLKDLTPQEVRRPMAPKVQGSWILHQLSKDLPLDFFVTFSSWASVLGAQDLAHYIAANQFMDALAHYRRGQGLPALSVNWGAWDVIRNATGELMRDYL